MDGSDRFEFLLDLEDKPSDRPKYSEDEVEDKLAPLGAFNRDFPPVIEWDAEIVGISTRFTEKLVSEMLTSCGLANCGITYIIPGKTDQSVLQAVSPLVSSPVAADFLHPSPSFGDLTTDFRGDL